MNTSCSATTLYKRLSSGWRGVYSNAALFGVFSNLEDSEQGYRGSQGGDAWRLLRRIDHCGSVNVLSGPPDVPIVFRRMTAAKSSKGSPPIAKSPNNRAPGM